MRLKGVPIPHRDVMQEEDKMMVVRFASFFKKIYLFSLEDNYSIVMVSAIHQRESAIGVHMSPPS